MNNSTLFLTISLLALAAVVVALGFARRSTLLLTTKYLVKRRLAWVSLAAVALCVALVLIVLSVMGGWLQQFRAQFKVLSGDLIVSKSATSTFAYYDEMIAEFEKDPNVDAAVPIIRTAGLLTIPAAQWSNMVSVVGLPPLPDVERVMSFKESLWYQYDIGRYGDGEVPLRDDASFDLYDDLPYAAMSPKDKQATKRGGLIVGARTIDVRMNPLTKRPNWPDYLRELGVKLTVLPMNEELGTTTQINATTSSYWIVDGSRTQAPQHDENIYVPFDQLQADLKLTGYSYKDSTTKEQKTEPAKTSEIQIKLKAGADRAAVKQTLQAIVNRVLRSHDPIASTQPATTQDDQDIPSDESAFHLGGVRVLGWDEVSTTRKFLNAVENEITIMMTLFGCISLVAVFMIFCIFYTIVAEKTRDIGILKSVGSSAWNVAQIFLTYGAAIGFVGGGLGVAMGWAFVRNINEIHGYITKITGREVYSSDVYAIDRLPTHVDMKFAIIIWIIGIFAAIIGAILPAIRAARMNPVESLRFE